METRLFEVKELHVPVISMNMYKTHGPNNFSIAFLQKCWTGVKEDVMEFFQQFYFFFFVGGGGRERLLRGASIHILFLLSQKKKNGEVCTINMRDYQSISLVGSFYKIL